MFNLFSFLALVTAVSSFDLKLPNRAEFLKHTAALSTAGAATVLLPVGPANARGRATLDYAYEKVSSATYVDRRPACSTPMELPLLNFPAV